MNETNGHTPEQTPPEHHRRRRHGKRLLVLAVMGVVAVLVLPAAFARGGGGWGGGWHGHHGGKLTLEQVRGKLDWFAGRFASRIDADDAQEKRITSILTSKAPEILKFRAEGKALKKELIASMADANPDPAKLEKLRKSMVSLVDRGSTRLLDTVMELSAELTPAQRKDLAEDFQRFAKWQSDE